MESLRSEVREDSDGRIYFKGHLCQSQILQKVFFHNFLAFQFKKKERGRKSQSVSPVFPELDNGRKL